MVSEVSAIEVASTTLRRPGSAGLHRPVLLAPVESAVERRDVDGGVGDPLAQHCLDAADLALARQEDEDRAGSRRGARAVTASGDLVLDAPVRIAAEIAGLDREGATLDSTTGASPSSRATRAPSRVADMTRRRRSSRSPPWASSASARPRSASRQRSWNSSKSTAATPSSAGSSRIMRVNTPSVTTSMRVRGRDLRAEAHPEADGLADRLAERLRHALRRGAGGEAARFQHDDLAARHPRLVEQYERDARRLARARRRDEHRARSLAQPGGQVAQDGIDGKRLIEMLHGSGRTGPDQAGRPRRRSSAERSMGSR